MTSTAPLILYDISSTLQPQSYAPNPSKARYALSFKAVPFSTTFVDLPNIPDVRRSLNCPATRKLDDGSDFFTLPMVQDPESGKVLGDTFDIANYLDDVFPDSGAGRLFPPNTKRTGLDFQSPHNDSAFYAPLTILPDAKNQEYAKFNVEVDATFTSYVILVAQLFPFPPESADAIKALFVKRAHLKAWDDLAVHGEARKGIFAAFKTNTKTLSEFYEVNEGPYLEGETPTYADMIVGGWLNTFAVNLPKEEWDEIKAWHGGVFGKLHDALRERFWVCK